MEIHHLLTEGNTLPHAIYPGPGQSARPLA
jgi:hypothetical protein